jgi:superoxide dismutase, Fe-Mn family
MDTSPRPGPFQLPALPWDEAALDPVISARTISFHYAKHHLGYVKKLNELVTGTPLADLELEAVIAETADEPAAAKIFNQAAQVWNHTFYWESLTPRGGAKPSGELATKIDAAFGGFDAFKEIYTNAAVDNFGSGWAWLVAKGGKIDVVTTSNAHTPLTSGATPLLVIDVWEHAYYLDYQNDRKKHVKAVIDKLLDWNMAAQRLAAG